MTKFHQEGDTSFFHRNEFHSEKSFYLTNSLLHAFEHPLHVHPGKLIVPISVLHGEDHSTSCKVAWFEELDTKWKEFCGSNFFHPNDVTPHEFDVVIGPSCVPRGMGTGLEVLAVRGQIVTQICFASLRSRNWLQNYVVCLLREV